MTAAPPTHAALMERVGYRFRKSARLAGALTHPSAPGASAAAKDGLGYERLEFLGDRVLGLVVAEMLLERFPRENEGALSKRLVALVRKEALVEVADAIDLADALALADGSGRAHARHRETAKADGVEALLGAIFLDGGFQAAQTFVQRWWRPLLDKYSAPPKDPKTTLQEWAQGRSLPLPVYRVLASEGPDHQPTFDVAVDVESLPSQQARGRSKRAAEQAAATLMLEAITAAGGEP